MDLDEINLMKILILEIILKQLCNYSYSWLKEIDLESLHADEFEDKIYVRDFRFKRLNFIEFRKENKINRK